MQNNKSNKIIKNLLFVFLVILIIIGICFFNYKMDPYNIFEERDYFFLNDYPRDLINIAIKNYKGPEVDTVLIGSSDSVTMFGDYNKKYFKLLCIDAINYKQYKDILEYYIKINPNTKNVIIITSYSNLINNIYIPISEFNEKENKLKNFQKLFFSYETTKNSINILKENIKNNILNKDNQNEKFIYEYKPYMFDEFNLNKEEIDCIEKENIESIYNLINFLNEKNLNYTLIIPPYNATYLYLINDKKIYKEKINNFKKYIVNIVKENTKIYDFAFVNKYTSSDIFENKDILYLNSSHPSIIWGAKIHKILYNKDKKYDDIYFLLNKNNVESVIKKESLLLDEYIKNNKKTIEIIKKISENQNKETFSETKIISEDQTTEETKNELKFLIELRNK